MWPIRTVAAERTCWPKFDSACTDNFHDSKIRLLKVIQLQVHIINIYHIKYRARQSRVFAE